jgi:hypothetical protein
MEDACVARHDVENVESLMYEQEWARALENAEDVDPAQMCGVMYGHSLVPRSPTLNRPHGYPIQSLGAAVDLRH